MTLKAQSANPTPAETDDGLDEIYYTELLKMKLDNAVWVDLKHCLHILFLMFSLSFRSHTVTQSKFGILLVLRGQDGIKDTQDKSKNVNYVVLLLRIRNSGAQKWQWTVRERPK